jgi:hypothetical protein
MSRANGTGKDTMREMERGRGAHVHVHGVLRRPEARHRPARISGRRRRRRPSSSPTFHPPASITERPVVLLSGSSPHRKPPTSLRKREHHRHGHQRNRIKNQQWGETEKATIFQCADTLIS